MVGNKIKRHFREVLRIKTSPHEIALGFSVGTFIAILPTFGLGVLIGLLVILIYEKMSKVSLLASFAIWNPFVLVPIGVLNYYVGNIFLRDLPPKIFSINFFTEIYSYSVRYFLGSLIVGAIVSAISYFVLKKIVKAYQEIS